MLSLYNLQLSGMGKYGYFRWKEHICAFIDKHWTTLFGFSRYLMLSFSVLHVIQFQSYARKVGDQPEDGQGYPIGSALFL